MYVVGLTSNYHLTKECNIILEDGSWWTSLVNQICKEADRFEIRCWRGEADAIDTGLCYGIPVENTTTEELVYTGRITSEFRKDITTNYLTKDYCLKWFTLILYRDEKMLFLSEHYGTEVHLLYVAEEDLQGVKSWVEQYSSVDILHINQMEENEIIEDEIFEDEIFKDEINDNGIYSDHRNNAVDKKWTKNNNEILSISEEGIQEITNTFRKYFN